METRDDSQDLLEGSEEKNLKHYELLYIIPVKYTVEELPQVNAKVKNLLAEYGSAVTYEEDLGKKKLAYPIKHAYHGYYFVTEFNLATDKLKTLNNSLRLMPDVLRHLVIAKPERTAQEIAAEKERRHQVEVAEMEELKEKITTQTPVSITEKPEVKETTKGKVSIEDLDKKLDELIDDSIL